MDARPGGPEEREGRKPRKNTFDEPERRCREVREGPEKSGRKQKGGSRSVTPKGNPVRIKEEDPPGIPPWDSTGGSSDVECGGVLLSHTLSSAVPSPRPGLSFRVRKGTGRLTWAMTTAKPIQRPTHQGIGRQRNQPRFRSWRSGNRTTDANKTPYQHHPRDHKKQCSLPSNEKNHHRTRPNPPNKERVGKCAAFAR